MFSFGMKSARVADQIDAEVKAGKALVENAEITAKQFDFYEQQLSQFASMIQSADPSAAMQFQMLQQQINNTQSQIAAALNQIKQTLANIDALTDKIQN
jgi:chromosome segregation ATPase